MANAGARRTAVGCLLVLALWFAAAPAEEGDQLLATVDQPARISATEATRGNTGAGVRRVVVSVTHYHPADDGLPIEAVVKARAAGGVDKDIGRFGITPDREFTSTAPSTTQHFIFALPQEIASDLAAGQPVTFSVHLVPVRGEGKGAALRVGAIEFR